MEPPNRRLRVHFFGQKPDRGVLPLAGVLGVGPVPRPTGTAHRRYERLLSIAPVRFEVVPAEQAQVWVFAHEISSRDELDRELQKLPSSQQHCAFFYDADDAAPIPVQRRNVALFRTSLFASTRLDHERAMPALCDDVVAEIGGTPKKRAWSSVPSIGFCGFVGSPLKRISLKLLGQHQKNDGLYFRDRVLNAIGSGESVLRTEFVRRSSFWGGAMSRFHFDKDVQRKVRAEFVHNLIDTDYGLCMRGKGNFSYRFYEVLSAGRVPVLVNSDCVLPFDREIDWKQHVVWIEDSELDTLAERVVEFHRNLGSTGFDRLQSDNRVLWETWLSPEAFYLRALESLVDH